MSHILQLNPSIPVNTPKGSGEAWFILDYGPEFDTMMGVCIDQTGEIWIYKISELRGLKNITLGRTLDDIKTGN